MIIGDWKNCYGESWKGILIDEAFSHPAKFSRALIRRIYRHAIDEGWLCEGDYVVDPFGGIAAGAYDAMRFGLHWIGCELEPRFCDLGRQNILKWNAEHNANFKKWGSATLLQGDSRRLGEILRTEAECVVSSPPFGEGETRDRRKPGSGFVVDMMSRAYTQDRQGTTPGNLSNLAATEDGFSAAISSPPYAQSIHDGNGIDADKLTRNPPGANSQVFAEGYGKSDGQLGTMREGQFDASVSSPPYNPPMSQDHNGTHGGKRGIEPSEPGAFVRYGNTPGQLEGLPMDGFDASVSSPPLNMAEGKFNASVSSPPFEKCTQVNNDPNNMTAGKAIWAGGKDSAKRVKQDYNEVVSLGEGETFWSAAKQIVEQIHAALKPGGHAIFVLKDYVRNKERVPFCERWMLLCESVGFKTLHWHRAWLVEDYGTQQDLLGKHKENVLQRKSFFRRLAEKKGSPRIDFEVVLCMEKP